MSQNIQQKSRERKIKGIADIVFCIDASGSMTPCLEGVKNHIWSFLQGLKSNQEFDSIDWRLGILAYDESNFYILKFTDDQSRFQQALTKIHPGGDEFTLPALDWSLDFSWREEAQKIVVLFTDEPLETGREPAFQQSKLEELRQKIVTLRAMVYFVGPLCQEYQSISELPRCIFESIDEHEDFYNIGFDKVMERIGQTISRSVGATQGAGRSYNKDIYNINGKIRQILL